MLSPHERILCTHLRQSVATADYYTNVERWKNVPIFTLHSITIRCFPLLSPSRMQQTCGLGVTRMVGTTGATMIVRSHTSHRFYIWFEKTHPVKNFHPAPRSCVSAKKAYISHTTHDSVPLWCIGKEITVRLNGGGDRGGQGGSNNINLYRLEFERA